MHVGYWPKRTTCSYLFIRDVAIAVGHLARKKTTWKRIMLILSGVGTVNIIVSFSAI